MPSAVLACRPHRSSLAAPLICCDFFPGAPVDSFSVGEHVIIRYGERAGQHGLVVNRQLAEIYEVRLKDGTTLFFSRQSLGHESVGHARLPALTRGSPSRN
jgi:hypothetical protein